MRRLLIALAGLALVPAVVVVADAASVREEPYVAGSTLGEDGRYPTNRSGQTYGSELDADSPDALPDLISAWATNGNLGYVLKSELHDAIYNSDSPGGTLKVYDREMQRIVGEFEITPANSVAESDEVIIRGTATEDE